MLVVYTYLKHQKYKTGICPCSCLIQYDANHALYTINRAVCKNWRQIIENLIGLSWLSFGMSNRVQWPLPVFSYQVITRPVQAVVY